uniref:HAT C-terminal dimerisation domain-containing protein n=1 Tax=Solanum lycopersicum TaxID=4081 RepID=A0A3Q7G2G1_SOLLC
MDEYLDLESDETNNDFDLYFNRAQEKIRREEGELQPRILNWWKNRENQFPTLSRIVRDTWFQTSPNELLTERAKQGDFSGNSGSVKSATGKKIR